jgi:hypothetical protein
MGADRPHEHRKQAAGSAPARLAGQDIIMLNIPANAFAPHRLVVPGGEIAVVSILVLPGPVSST